MTADGGRLPVRSERPGSTPGPEGIATAPVSGRPNNQITLLEPAAAAAVRRWVRRERARAELDEASVGIFGPVRYVEATGRARCRECGQRITRGERCVTFQLDLYLKRFGRWGHAVDAYIHVKCPDQEGES